MYIDPWQIGEAAPADLILVTHDHPDHCLSDNVAKIQNDDTVIVMIKAVAEKLSGQIQVVKPGDEITVKGGPVSVVPSYNVDEVFHP